MLSLPHVQAECQLTLLQLPEIGSSSNLKVL